MDKLEQEIRELAQRLDAEREAEKVTMPMGEDRWLAFVRKKLEEQALAVVASWPEVKAEIDRIKWQARIETLRQFRTNASRCSNAPHIMRVLEREISRLEEEAQL